MPEEQPNQPSPEPGSNGKEKKSTETKPTFLSSFRITVLIIIVSTITTLATAYYLLVLNRETDSKFAPISQEYAPSAKPATPSAKPATPSAKPATPSADPSDESINTQYILGVSFDFDKSLGSILLFYLTNERVNLSSEVLLAEEKKVYGDKQLFCNANDYPLGRITVKDESKPFLGDELIKKLGTGKYLYYSDHGLNSFCYEFRPKLRSLQKSQTTLVKQALETAK